MSMNNLNKDIEKLLKKSKTEPSIIYQLDELIKQYGPLKLDSWRNINNETRNSLLHEFVLKQYYDVIRHMLSKYNLKTSIKRDSDGLTPFDLAYENHDWKMCDLLLELNDEKTFTDTYEQFATKIHRQKLMNLVWLDLEFTSFENPQILECAVIITDRDLNELERKEWVIHFEQNVLDSLGDWHQNAFKDRHVGGNGLFSDVIHSTLTKEQVEEELLDIIKRYCPESACPLAGSSVHVDREVLKVEMPKVYRYLHYRVVDVSSFREMMKRWAPLTASKFVRELAANGRENISHRAMDDIEWSIELMKMFRPLLTARIPQSIRKSSNSNSRAHRSMILRNLDESVLSSDDESLLERLKLERNNVPNNPNQRLYDQNPHLREVFLNNETLIFFEEEFNSQNRFLDLSRHQSAENKQIHTTEQWKQRQLLLSEIEFLTDYANEENCLVVYAGAAPGIHLNYLSRLFPQVDFVLIDSYEFVATETDRIIIIQEEFTDKWANKYAKEKRKVLFICNIRTGDTESDIEEDTSNLILWQSMINSFASLLTLRFSRSSEQTLFYEGRILLDVWSSRKTTDYRLIVEKNALTITYDNLAFEKAMHYFQNVLRIKYYPHDFDNTETEGLDHCYDCRAEIFILEKYITKMQSMNDPIEFKKKIAELSYDISRNIYEKNRQPIINTIRTLNIIPKK